MKSLITLCILQLIYLTGCGGAGGSSGNNVYVAIGASDATGIGATPLTNGYVFRINNQLDKSCGATELNNLGLPGATADQIENVELPIAKEIHPEIVTIFVGGNDLTSGRSTESFEIDVRNILSTLEEDTSALIFIANLPDISQLPRYLEDPDSDVTLTRVRAFNDAISRQAQLYNVTVIDLFAVGVNDVLISDDGFHPNDAGHEEFADLFLQQIIPQFCGKPYP